MTLNTVSVKSLRARMVEYIPLSGDEWNPAQRSLFLWKRDDIEWNTARLEIEIVAPKKEIEKLGKERDDLSVVVSAQCVATNLRQAVIASRSPSDESIWSCTLELDRRNMRGPVRLQSHLAGTVSGQAHRYLASADEWMLYFEQTASPTPNGALPIQWVDFGAADIPVFLKKYVNEPMYADLEGTPLPKVYLNKGFEGLAALFIEKPRPTGARLALHEAERISLAKGIWLGLFQVALAAVEEPEEGEEGVLPGGWQGEVLEKMLARLHPELEPAGRLDKAIQERRSDGTRHFESVVLAAVSQDMIKEGKGLHTSLLALEQAARVGTL